MDRVASRGWGNGGLLSVNGTLSYRSNAVGNRSRTLHVFAWVLAAATFPLICMGGLVTSHKAGMSVPDWPNSYGYNMFLFPPRLWIQGIFYEHTHRLLGTVVGFAAILLTASAYSPCKNGVMRHRVKLAMLSLLALTALFVGVMIATKQPAHSPLWHGVVGLASLAAVGGALLPFRNAEPRRWVRMLCAAILVGVIIQGGLGGARVDLVNVVLAMIHACVAQTLFCGMIVAVVVTSSWWTFTAASPGTPSWGGGDLFFWEGTNAQESHRHPNPPPAYRERGSAVARFSVLCLITLFVQLIVAATMRHSDAGLAIPDLPWAYGKLLPPTNASDLASANAARAWTFHLPADLTFWKVWLHFAHRCLAVVLTVELLALSGWLLAGHRGRGLTAFAVVLPLLLATQVTLGVYTVILQKPADVASMHVATGALLLATVAGLVTRTLRVYSGPFRRLRTVGNAGSSNLFLDRPVPTN